MQDGIGFIDIHPLEQALFIPLFPRRALEWPTLGSLDFVAILF